MPFASTRRARVRLLRLGLAVMLLGLWLLPGTPQVAARPDARSRPAKASNGPGCGHDWSAARLIGHLPGNLLEVSGFASSARHPGLAWMIRDSQNPESLYSFELDGDQPRWTEFPVTGNVSNMDWEDVTYTTGADGRGRLWILENDFANGAPDNDSAMKIYEVLEPDPTTDRTAHLAATYEIAYPGGNLNTESIFALDGKLLVVAKTNPNRVFRLPWPLDPSGVNWLTEIGGLEAGSLLTAVGASGDERYLVSIGIADDVSVFENRGLGNREFAAFDKQGPVFFKALPDTQREAIDFFPFNGCDIISISEDGTVWRLSNPRTVFPQGTPGPPTGVTVVPGNDGVKVTWSPPADTGGVAAAVTAYRVAVRQQDVEIDWDVTPDHQTLVVTVSDLTQGVPYTFSVSALSASGEGPPSPPTPPVTLGASPPPAPGVQEPVAGSEPPPPPAAPGSYWMVGSDGVVHAFGGARHFGQPVAQLGATRAVDLEPTPSGAGYWVVDDRGRVHAFGDAGVFGHADPAGLQAGETVTSLSATPSGDGYWLFTSRGRVLAFAGARHLGDMARVKLNGPVLDSVATPSGGGYYMVAADGGIFAFGDAKFFGSMGAKKLNAPVQSLVPDPDRAGYWLVAADGGVFAFDAPFRGSLGGTRLNKPVTGMVRYGNGYLMVGEDGGIFNFSDRPFSGSLGDRPPAHPIVSVAALG